MRDGRRRTQTTSGTKFGSEQSGRPSGRLTFCLAGAVMTQHPDDKLELQIGPAIEGKFIGDGSDIGVFDGYGATFGGVDSYGDMIAPGAFADTIAKHQAARTAPALLWNHNMDEPVGKLIGMQEDAHGLHVKGKLNLNTAAGVKAHEHLKAGDVSGRAFGYTLPPGGEQKQRAGPRILKKLQLHEVSIVAMPADARARVTGIKMLTSISELERGLRGEISLKLSRGAAAKIAAVGWPALVGGEDDPPQPDPKIIAGVRAVRAQIATLATKIDASVLELKSMKKGT